MDESLDLKFKYTEKEYTEAVKWYYSNLLNSKIDIIASLISIFIGSFYWVTGSDSIIFKFLVAIGCLLLIMIIIVLYVNPKRFYKMQPKLHDEYNISFSYEGIIFRTININSTIAWNHYSKVRESKKFFYLIYGKFMFTIIPKRTFINNEQEE